MFEVDLQVLCHPWLLTITFCLLHPVLVIKWVDFCSKKAMLKSFETPNQIAAKENFKLTILSSGCLSVFLLPL